MSHGGSKFDFNKIVENIRQVIPKGSPTPDPIDGDTLGKLMEEISTLSKGAAEKYAELTQTMYSMEEKVNQLYQDLESFRRDLADKTTASDQSHTSGEGQSSSEDS